MIAEAGDICYNSHMGGREILLCYLGRKGGGAVYSYEMAKALAATGCKVTAVISKYVENLGFWQQLPIENVIAVKTYTSKITYLVNSILFPFTQKKKIKRALGGARFDALYIPMTAYWDAKIMKCALYSQLVATLHDPVAHTGESRYNSMVKADISEADKLVVLSKEFVEFVSGKYRKPVAFIPHGRFNYYKGNFPSGDSASVSAGNDEAERGSDSDGARADAKITFLFFGRLTEYKGLRVLADAFRLCQDKMDNYSLVVAGSGKWADYEKYFAGIKNLKVLNKWFGDREVDALFRAPNVVTVLPYTDATQSGVIPIAKEYKSAVIATNTGGLKEQIEDGATGLLVSPSDAGALAGAMLRLYGDAALRARLAEAAYKGLEELNWDRLAEKLVNFIRL